MPASDGAPTRKGAAGVPVARITLGAEGTGADERAGREKQVAMRPCSARRGRTGVAGGVHTRAFLGHLGHRYQLTVEQCQGVWGIPPLARLCIRSSVVSAVGDRHGLADSISARPIPGVKKMSLHAAGSSSRFSVVPALSYIRLATAASKGARPHISIDLRSTRSLLHSPPACLPPARHHGSAPGRRRQQHAIFSAADNRLQAVHAKGFPIAGASKSFRQSEGPGTRGARKPSAASALAREACQP